MKRSRRSAWVAGTLLLCLAFGPVLAAVARPPERPYAFIGKDHPIDLWRDGVDRWAYYGADFGPSSDMAARAWASLLPLGFAEDAGQRPWYRFVRGDEEVVVCDHDQLAVSTQGFGEGKLMHERIPGKPQNDQCVLVKNGPGTHESTALFQVEKLLHGW